MAGTSWYPSLRYTKWGSTADFKYVIQMPNEISDEIGSQVYFTYMVSNLHQKSLRLCNEFCNTIKPLKHQNVKKKRLRQCPRCPYYKEITWVLPFPWISRGFHNWSVHKDRFAFIQNNYLLVNFGILHIRHI